jgi:glycerol-3-phosphate acyltransferase PlsY
MPEVTAALVARAVASFLIGSVPFAVISMWGTGVDIRTIGSGNPGFNNVLRFSKWRALICLAGDLGKGVLAVWLLTRSLDPASVRWILGFAAMLGHCYTPWLRFNGGKGIAVSAGIMLVLYPLLALPCVVAYVAGRVVGRKLKCREEGALASLGSAALFVVLVFLSEGNTTGAYAAVLFVIVAWRHKDNIQRLLQPAGT